MKSARAGFAAFALALFSFLVSGCAGGSRARKLAFIDAGAAVRRQETGHTFEEARKDLELFIERDVVLVRQKAKESTERVVLLDRWGFGVGTGLAALGASAGSLSGGARGVFGTVGVGMAVGSLADYWTRVSGLKRCQVFLDGAEDRLRTFERKRLAGEGTLPKGTWDDYVALTAEIQRFPGCLAVR
ncbi:MAG TPA: hypothetical protein VGR00_04505 [Thermoanaerobaculia bacterium]|jgi:hypothetical protein|nr:hypothetical protein [Thermoanaerobaculia bacterium]